MKTAVDTSALFALLYPDDEHNDRASELLGEAYRSGAVVVTPVVYTELAADPSFDSPGELDGFLEETGIAVDVPDRRTLFRAGRAFRSHLDRRGDGLQCPSCGAEATFECPDCGNVITARQHVGVDFVIGAHAEREADALVTFDAGFFRDYFDVDVRAVAGN